MSGYCLIPSNNVKRYGRVIRRLRKDRLEYTEDLVETSFTAISTFLGEKNWETIRLTAQPVQPMVKIVWS